MCCSRAAALAVIAASVAGCGRGPQRPVEHLAILPFENLSKDAGADWIGRAAQLCLALQTAGAPRTLTTPVRTLRDAYLARATRVLHGYFSAEGNRIRFAGAVEDLASHTVVRPVNAEGDRKDGLPALIDRLARGLEIPLRPPPTGKEAALRRWIEALSAADPGVAQQDFQAAANEDPDFGALYVSWAEWQRARGAETDDVLLTAASRKQRIPTIERAKLELLSAASGSDRRRRIRALEELARLLPADPSPARELAARAMEDRQFETAVKRYLEAVGRDPGDAASWNSLGYSQALAGDLQAAKGSLTTYRSLAPGDANPFDSLGEVHFILGKFEEAERFFLSAHERDALFFGGAGLWKAAQARLMTGDVARADAHFKAYLDLRRKLGDRHIPLHQASWDYTCGRRAKAADALSALTADPKTDADLASLASSQLAVWDLVERKAEAARRHASRAQSGARSPEAKARAAIASLLAEPVGSTSELRARVEHAIGGPAAALVRRRVMAYGLLFARRWNEALLELQEVSRSAGPLQEEDARELLAWTLVEMGNHAEAAAFVKNYEVPSTAPESMFTALSFPRLFTVRAAILEKQGKLEEAKNLRARYGILTEERL